MKRFSWRLGYYLDCFLEGDQWWGILRLICAVATILCVAIVGRSLEPVDATEWANFWQDFIPQMKSIPTGLLALMLSFFKAKALRHWIMPVSAIAFAIAAGTLYVQDIFEFKSFRLAFRYVFASMFGLWYPSLTIRNGQKVGAPDKPNTLDKIGGPGYLDIKLGNAVLLERGAGPTQVLGGGRFFARRFESIREIVNLREMHRKKDVEATTRDGIEMTFRDVEAAFRIDTGKQQDRTNVIPYPFSVQAVRVAVYDRSVGKEGGPGDWADAVMGAIGGEIRKWVATQHLDRMTAPPDEDPRNAIRKILFGGEFRKKLKHMGAELVWVNIGHLDTPPKVDEQRIDNWQSFWQSQEVVTDAHGEALRIDYEQLGRSEGQAEMLLAISRVLNSLGRTALLNEQIADLMLLRMGQVLEAMTAQPGLSEEKQYSSDARST